MAGSAEAGGKGLRQFSRQVWMKCHGERTHDVQARLRRAGGGAEAEATAEARAKADAAAATSGEIIDPATFIKPATFDDRNVRRRCYDALNVLMALGIIAKNKKNITWCGLPAGYGTPELTLALRGGASGSGAGGGHSQPVAVPGSVVGVSVPVGTKRSKNNAARITRISCRPQP